MHIILVHGAFHTGACWYRLRPILEGRGYTVHTPTLRGQAGNPRHPLLVSWKTYTEDIVATARPIGEPAILLGHSLAGFAISAAAERRPDLFATIIYLAAAIPKLGRSTLRDAVAQGQTQGSRPKLGLRFSFPAPTATDSFYNRCTPEVRDEATPLLSLQPLRPLLGAMRTTEERLGSVPKHFFECLDDRVMSIAGQREKQANLAFQSIQTLDSDHSPFLSYPNVLADAIERVAPPRAP